MLPTDGKPALFCVLLHVKMLPSLKNYLNIYASILNSSHWVKLVASSLTVLRIGFFLLLEHFVNVNNKHSTSFPFTVKTKLVGSVWEWLRTLERSQKDERYLKLLFNINKWWVRFEEQVFDWLDLRIGSGSFFNNASSSWQQKETVQLHFSWSWSGEVAQSLYCWKVKAENNHCSYSLTVLTPRLVAHYAHYASQVTVGGKLHTYLSLKTVLLQQSASGCLDALLDV